MLNFCDFIQVYVFTTNHHLNTSIFSKSVDHDKHVKVTNYACSQVSCPNVSVYHVLLL